MNEITKARNALAEARENRTRVVNEWKVEKAKAQKDFDAAHSELDLLLQRAPQDNPVTECSLAGLDRGDDWFEDVEMAWYGNCAEYPAYVFTVTEMPSDFRGFLDALDKYGFHLVSVNDEDLYRPFLIEREKGLAVAFSTGQRGVEAFEAVLHNDHGAIHDWEGARGVVEYIVGHMTSDR